MNPQTIWFILFGVVVLGAVGAVLWGVYSGRLRTAKAGKQVRSGIPAKSGKLLPARDKARSEPRPARRSGRQQDGLERKYIQAKKRFNKTIDRRIGREPIIGERLRRHRDMVLGWYDQKGKVEKVRYQASDSRSACKVCQGRHGKEYGLLDTDVVARILPPSHTDEAGRKECLCTVTPVMQGDPQAAAPRNR